MEAGTNVSSAPKLRVVQSPTGKLLEQHQFKLFTSSAISPDVAAERGYRSIQDEIELSRTPYNFSPQQAEQVPALLIPLWNVVGQNTHYGFRPDMPVVDERGKQRKYQMPPRKGVIVDVPPRVSRSGIFDDYQQELWITESPLKADSAVSQGLNCITIWGVWSWRARTKAGGTAVLPDFEKISWRPSTGGRGRPVYIVFDSDTRSNIQVNFGRSRLINWLRLLGADVWVIDLPPDKTGAKQGLDDYFAHGGTVEKLRGNAIPGDDRIRIIETDEYTFTDIGNAERFAWLLGEQLRSVDGSRDWLLWQGGRWDIADEEDVLSLAMEIPPYIEEQAKLLSNSIPEGERTSPQDKRRASARKLESYNALTNMIKTARGLPALRVKGAQFDNDPWLFNVANGTINLKTGQLYPHRPDDLITNLSPVSYQEGHSDPRWERFLLDITQEDREYLAFLQRALGMSLLGETTFEGLFFAYGGTATGKSTLFDAMRSTWGDYGAVANFKSFLRSKDGSGSEGPRPDLYKLIGKRLITSVEVEKGASLAADLIKQMTGGSGEIVVRDLYGKANQYRTWRPTSLWLAANDRPRVESSEEAIWRRIWTLPFLHSVRNKGMDETLKPYLRDPKRGGAAVLSWAVEGCLLWQNEGRKLDQPHVITQANEDYRNEMDPYLEWKGELQVGPEYKALSSHLHASFMRWCEENGVPPGSRSNPSSFGKWVKEQFTIYGKPYPDKGSTMLTGVGIPEGQQEQVERYAKHLKEARQRR